MIVKKIINISKEDNLDNIISSLKKIKQASNNFDPDAINITALHLKDEYFYNFIFNRFILNICKKYFQIGSHKFSKNNFQFDTINTRVLKKKAKPQKLHIDSRMCGVYPPIRMQFLFYLDDVINKDGGATHLIPGSHKYSRYPTQRDLKKAKRIYGKKGSFIAIDSSIWHGSSKKNNIEKRTLIAMAYNRWIVRQSFANAHAIKNSQKLKFNLEQKYILGYFNYADKSGSRPKVPMSTHAIKKAKLIAKGSRNYDETIV